MLGFFLSLLANGSVCLGATTLGEGTPGSVPAHSRIRVFLCISAASTTEGQDQLTPSVGFSVDDNAGLFQNN